MGPADSRRISRAPRYSGLHYASATIRVRGSHPLRPPFPGAFHLVAFLRCRGPTTPAPPQRRGFGLLRVRSPLLAESYVIFSSCGYLDVSVPHVRPGYAGDGPPARRVAPFGHPRIKGYLLLPVAFRSLSRPSSPPRAKASTVCPCLLSARRTSSCGLIYLKLALLVFYSFYLLLMSNMSKISFSWRMYHHLRGE